MRKPVIPCPEGSGRVGPARAIKTLGGKRREGKWIIGPARGITETII